MSEYIAEELGDFQSRLSRSKPKEKAAHEEKRVESANSLQGPDFFQRFAPELPSCNSTDAENSTFSDIKWVANDASMIKKVLLEQCFLLIEETSAKDYQCSEMKWSPAKKKKEMVLPDMKYILLLKINQQEATRDQDVVVGFVSFMITYEDGHEVIYIYEIHFAQKWQGKGLGGRLMSFVETIGQNVGIEKAMLTVFRANNRAVTWYQRLGYVEDEFSPGPRKLRNGATKQPSYMILSKQNAR